MDSLFATIRDRIAQERYDFDDGVEYRYLSEFQKDVEEEMAGWTNRELLDGLWTYALDPMRGGE